MTSAAVALIVDGESPAQRLRQSAIGERAGYSRRLATHRFGSKARLLAQVRDTTVADWIAQVPHIVGAKTGIAAVDSVVDVPSYF